jgi:DNA-binding response OmpR family regulator
MMMLRLAERLGRPLGRAVEAARYQAKPIKVKDVVAEVERLLARREGGETGESIATQL